MIITNLVIYGVFAESCTMLFAFFHFLVHLVSVGRGGRNGNVSLARNAFTDDHRA